MRRRTFIGLTRLGAAFWLPSIVKASQEPIAADGTATTTSTNQQVPQDECTFPFGSSCQQVIKVIGVGSAGRKAIEHMIGNGVRGVDLVVADSDTQALERCSAKMRIQLGQSRPGSRSKPEAAFQAAMDSRQRITECVKGAHMVIIVAGLGSGTGTGATSAIADISRTLGILTVGLVTMPFSFEGQHRRIAATKTARLQSKFDSLIVIENDRLVDVVGEDMSMDEMFESMNNIIREIVSGMTAMITTQGLVGVTFEDARTILARSGLGRVGVATATGIDRARVAAREAIASPFLEGVNLADAQGLLITITAKRGLTTKEINEVMDVVSQTVAEDTPIIHGTSYDGNMADDLRVTLFATGYMGYMGGHTNALAKVIALRPVETHVPRDSQPVVL